jgi:putative membrane protein
MGWDNDRWDGMNGFYGGHGYNGVGMGIFFIILLALGIWALIRVIRNNKKSNTATNSAVSFGKETPREILDRRFANGEINAEEYQQAKELLTQ